MTNRARWLASVLLGSAAAAALAPAPARAGSGSDVTVTVRTGEPIAIKFNLRDFGIEGTRPLQIVITDVDAGGTFTADGICLSYTNPLPDSQFSDFAFMEIRSGGVVLGTVDVEVEGFTGAVPTPVSADNCADSFGGDAEAGSPWGKAVANTLAAVCPALTQAESRTADQEDLFAQCNAIQTMLDAGDRAGAEAAYLQIAPEEMASQGTAALEAANRQTTNVGARLASLRAGAHGVDVGGLALSVDGRTMTAGDVLGETGGGAAADDGSEGMGGLGIFLNGAFNFGDKDATSTEGGFDFDGAGTTFGIDYRFSDFLVLGAAGGVAFGDVDFDSNGGGLETATYSASGYGTAYLGDAYLDVIGTYAWTDYDTERNITFPTNRRAKGDTDGEHYAIGAGAGYDFHLGGLSIGPYGRLYYLEGSIDEFTERGAMGSNLTIFDQSFRTFTTTAGAQASYAVSTGIGVFSPHARFEYLHEFQNDKRRLKASFAAAQGIPAPPIAVELDSPDRDYFLVGAGVSAVFAHGISAFFDYQPTIALEDITNHSFTGGVRFEF